MEKKRELTKEEIIKNLKEGLEVCNRSKNYCIMYGYVHGLLSYLGEVDGEVPAFDTE